MEIDGVNGVDPSNIKSKGVDLDDKPLKCELIVNPSSTALTCKLDRPNVSKSDHIKTPLIESPDDDMFELNKKADQADVKARDDALMNGMADRMIKSGADECEIETAVRALLPVSDSDLRGALDRANQASKALSKFWLSKELGEVQDLQHFHSQGEGSRTVALGHM